MAEYLERLETLDVEQYFLNRIEGKVFTTVQTDVEWDGDDETYTGEIVVAPVHAPDDSRTVDADKAWQWFHGGTWLLVDDHIVAEPEAILRRFAGEELSNYRATNHLTHEYNGIDGVDSLADIKAAQYLLADSDTSASLTEDDIDVVREVFTDLLAIVRDRALGYPKSELHRPPTEVLQDADEALSALGFERGDIILKGDREILGLPSRTEENNEPVESTQND